MSNTSSSVANRRTPVCGRSWCSPCVRECEIAKATKNEELSRLCALVIEMEGAAVPADDYRSDVIVDPEKLREAATLAYLLRGGMGIWRNLV